MSPQNPEQIGAALAGLGQKRVDLVDLLSGRIAVSSMSYGEFWIPPPTAAAYLRLLREALGTSGVVPWVVAWNPDVPGHLALTMGSDSEALRLSHGAEPRVCHDGTRRWRIQAYREIAGVFCVVLGPWHEPDAMPDWAGRGFG